MAKKPRARRNGRRGGMIVPLLHQPRQTVHECGVKSLHVPPVPRAFPLPAALAARLAASGPETVTGGAPGSYDRGRMDSSGRPSPQEIDVGTIFDRYEIVRHVARGGMGSVWLARFAGKHGFTKHVAIKTIVPELAENPQFHAMFLEEARISSKLVHANAAQVLDVGEHGRAVYIVFEWVDGRSVEELCRAAEARGERIPLPLILRALADASAGLHAAHILADEDGRPLGIVHRDVTPNNILVSDKGFAKVIDFGIAKARDRVAVEDRSGFVKGTPQYMSPEAAGKLVVDRRADVWSLGAILFRAL